MYEDDVDGARERASLRLRTPAVTVGGCREGKGAAAVGRAAVSFSFLLLSTPPLAPLLLRLLDGALGALRGAGCMATSSSTSSWAEPSPATAVAL